MLLLALASIRKPTSIKGHPQNPVHCFAIVIPAHNEAVVIQQTIQGIQASDYPIGMYEILVIADHCTDQTAELARGLGASVYERDTIKSGGKGAAISWLFAQILPENKFDAVIIFDADTKVDQNFLSEMDARLAQSDQVIQGRHIISNPQSGWFPALTWAMFTVDNRFQNQGRVNLGLSAKNMGDSICLRTSVLNRFGWGKGLTEDYELRQRLLLDGIRIGYEPNAKGFGEAPLTWTQARMQRTRWLRGAHEVGREFSKSLFVKGLKTRNLALIDGALQMYLPSYSTLTFISFTLLLAQLVVNYTMGPIFPAWLLLGWVIAAGLLFIYPFLGLALENAPVKSFLVIMTGPFYIIWRTILAFSLRLNKQPVIWQRTVREGSESKLEETKTQDLEITG